MDTYLWKKLITTTLWRFPSPGPLEGELSTTPHESQQRNQELDIQSSFENIESGPILYASNVLRQDHIIRLHRVSAPTNSSYLRYVYTVLQHEEQTSMELFPVFNHLAVHVCFEHFGLMAAGTSSRKHQTLDNTKCAWKPASLLRGKALVIQLHLLERYCT